MDVLFLQGEHESGEYGLWSAQLPEEFHPSVEHEICIRETLFQVHKILEKLPPRATQVFLLSQLDGLTYKMICEKLDISEATVKRDMKLAFLACISLLQ